jgi:hypothetical protein
MTDESGQIQELLENAVPRTDERGDWSRVVADSASASRRRLWALRGAIVVAVASLAAAGLLILPFGGDQPTLLERARAAVGEGSVIHLKLRGDWGPTLVDLSSGRRTPVHADTEVWYDPRRGLHLITTLGGVPQWDALSPAGRVPPAQREQYAGFATRYREALESGRARIVGSAEVAGRSVHWIRIHGEQLPDVADGRDHLFAHEVGVDRETFEPIFFRTTRDGKPPPGPGNLTTVLEFELLPEGEGNFTPIRKHLIEDGTAMMFGWGDELTAEESASALGGRTLWLGRAFAGLQLGAIRALALGERPKGADSWNKTRGVAFFYGELHRDRNEELLPDRSKPHVIVEQAPELSRAWRGAPIGMNLPEGSLLVQTGARFGFLRRNGIYVSIQARSERELLDAARALRPLD